MMFKRNLMNFKNTFMNKRFYSNNKKDYYIFNKNTQKYEINTNYVPEYYLSSLECFILYPISYTKAFFNALRSEIKK